MGATRWPKSTVGRRFLPFALVGVLALACVVLPPAPSNWSFVVTAAVLTAVIAAVAVFTPWSRLPRWTYMVAPLAYFPVIALLREAQGGSASGYAPLAILPVVWVALNLGLRQVAVSVGAVGLLFTLPLLIGAVEYPVGEWRRAILWLAAASIVGFGTNRLVSEKREEASRAANRAAELAESEAALRAVTRVTHLLTATRDTRRSICAAAYELTQASVVTIMEPDGRRNLVMAASAGLSDLHSLSIAIGDEPSGSVVAYLSGQRYFVPDAAESTAVVAQVRALVDVVSMLYEPIKRGRETIGVLCVGWDHHVADLSDRAARTVTLLAAGAAAAIDRAELVGQLERLARTDELTGLPNRRYWDRELTRAVRQARVSRQPLCVALVDLDHFKRFNDRYGHQAGDRVLKSAAAAWRSVLREGDTLARYGGEEFAVLLPDCGLDVAAVVLERMRGETPEGQTCSIGLALYTGGSATKLFDHVDTALYQAKRQGRDRLRTAIAAA